MRLIQDGMLDKAVCDTLIQLYQNNRNLCALWHDTNTLNLAKVESEHDQLAKKVIFAMASYLNTKGNIVYPELAQVVHRQKGSIHNLHLDQARPTTVMTSITYLNDDYDGGETFFEDGLSVKPKLGRSLFFDGLAYKHGVNACGGDRFVLAIWYTNDINNFYGIN